MQSQVGLGKHLTITASEGDGIPVELFQILKDDAVKVLHSICQEIWKTQQWTQDWKKSVFILISKKGNSKFQTTTSGIWVADIFSPRMFCDNFFKFFFFYFTILYWFCHTSTCICHRCTRFPNPERPSQFPPHTIPLGHPSAPAPSFLYPASNLDWRFISYMILYMF